MNNKNKSMNVILFSADFFFFVWQTDHETDQLNCYLTEGIAAMINLFILHKPLQFFFTMGVTDLLQQ